MLIGTGCDAALLHLGSVWILGGGRFYFARRRVLSTYNSRRQRVWALLAVHRHLVPPPGTLAGLERGGCCPGVTLGKHLAATVVGQRADRDVWRAGGGRALRTGTSLGGRRRGVECGHGLVSDRRGAGDDGLGERVRPGFSEIARLAGESAKARVALPSRVAGAGSSINLLVPCSEDHALALVGAQELPTTHDMR